MDNHTVFISKPDLIDPVMIVGWPGMGNVALGVVNYIRRSLTAEKFCEITWRTPHMHESVDVENGIARFPSPPRHSFFFTKSPDLIIIEGEAQLQGASSASLLETVITVAMQFKTKRIFAGAAFPLPISHREESEVYGAATSQAFMNELIRHKVKMMDGGSISGLNGLILGFAAQKKLEAACLLATMPQYAIGFSNPKASRAIIEVLAKMLGLHIDTRELETLIKDIDEKMALIENKAIEVFSGESDAPKAEEDFEAEKKKIPASALERIESLFFEAKRDKKKAYLLKRELDRWDLFKVYEDRFLDLFKESQ